MIPGTYNFREVAGVTGDGRRIREGRFYRSDTLARVTRDGRRQLRALGITRVIDLRTDFDRRFGGRDALRGTGAELVRIPIHGVPGVDPQTVNLRIVYRQMLGAHGAEIAAAIDAIATAPGPIVLHCTAGKDRTGLVTALSLLAIGVGTDDVVRDYMLTEERLAGEWSDRMLRRVRRFRVPLTDGVVEVVTRSPEFALRDTLAWLDEEHGGVPAYLDRVGVDAAAVARLRESLLA